MYVYKDGSIKLIYILMYNRRNSENLFEVWEEISFNPLRTKLYLSDLKIQFVTRSTPSLPRL
jgi:hypothetical protein